MFRFGLRNQCNVHVVLLYIRHKIKISVLPVLRTNQLFFRSLKKRGSRSGFESRSKQVGRDGIVVVSEPTFFSRRFAYSFAQQLHVITYQTVVEADLLSSTHDR